jgi:hypothetical protein
MDCQDNIALRDLQKLIVGERIQELSSMETRNLFSCPTSPESILFLITALNCKLVDPNTTLLQSIANAKSKEDILPIALALRYGADPNLYVNVPTVGNIHILGYSYLALSNRDLPVLNSVIILLSIKGTDPSMMVFDNDGGAIKDEFSILDPITGQSVDQWLNDQGFDTIIPRIANQNYEDVNNEFLTLLGVMLDDQEIINQSETTPDIIDVIQSHSMKVFNNINHNNHNNISGIDLAIRYLNLEAFEKYIDQGFLLTYTQVNELIDMIRKYHDIDNMVAMCQVKKMLLYSLEYGTEIDLYQYNMIKDTGDPEIISEIDMVYHQPYWKKICKVTSGLVPEKLKTLAYGLNLYPEYPKETLCGRIRRIVQADPDQVSKSLLTRQKYRIFSCVSHINEFSLDGNNIIPPNNISMYSDIYGYPDADIAFYLDSQDNIWVFPSRVYDKILDKKVNPYTNQEFPEYFLDRVKRNKDYRSKYTCDCESVPIPIVVNKLHCNDTINNNTTCMYEKLFMEILSGAGLFEWHIEKLSKPDMEKLMLDNFNVRTDLTNLTLEHAIKTFYIVSYLNLSKDTNDNDNNDISNYFTELEDMVNRKISKK